MQSTVLRFAALLFFALATALAPRPALAENMSAVIHKASVDVHSAPDFKAPTIATLKRDAAISIAGQQGLWFRVELPADEVRVPGAGALAGFDARGRRWGLLRQFHDLHDRLGRVAA